MPPLFFGIDLGTTYSTIACINESDSIAQAISDGNSIAVPSVVYFDTDGTPIVGTSAKNRLRIMDNAERTIKEFKLEMGEEYCKDPILIGPAGSNSTRQISPLEASACMLKQMKNIGIDYARDLGYNISKDDVFETVITVPAGFTFWQRMCTKRAAQKAGIKVLGLLQEPTAAALAHNIADGETILVFDLGGGTLDVSIVRRQGIKYEVIGVASDTQVLGQGRNLGGKDWDRVIASMACLAHQTKFDNLSRKEKAYMLSEAEIRKKELSGRNINDTLFIFSDNSSTMITRTNFERNSNALLNDCVKVVEAAILDAETRLGAEGLVLDRFVLVGGSSNMPMVSKKLGQKFTGLYCNGKESNQWMRVTKRPDSSIAEGAAIYARLLTQGQTIRDIPFINDRSQCSYGTSKIDKDGKYSIRNIIMKNEDMVVSEKVFCFKTHVNEQPFVYVDIFENNSLEETIPKDDSARQIFDERYQIDRPVRRGTPIEFRVSRDSDGLITIKVCVKGCSTQVFSADTIPISKDIEEQIQVSMQLMDD